MAFKFGKTIVTPAPVESTKVLPVSADTDRKIAQEVRINEAGNALVEEVMGAPVPAEYQPHDENAEAEARKLSRLIDDNFPFDESQLAAINGIANQRYACMTGAAGTGKTTSTKAIVDRLQDSIGSVDMSTYFKRGNEDDSVGEDDDYEMPDSAIPSIVLCGFTGRSTQQIKKNFPRDWHGNIMTIHRMLAFVPEFYEDWDADLGEMRNKMRFVPTYTRFNKMPWDVIVIDEAGMVSVELWEQLWAACKEGCRIIMIGDINQLPPVQGRSVFGFAMTKWPSWELTHIHRQVGKNNSIVDNAWKILKGERPISDEYQSDPAWKFAMMPIPEDSALASQKIRAWLAKMNGRAYHPHRDTVITAINGEDTSRGYALGQIPMNRELAIVFNKENPRFIIDAGRERKQFAVGDKVMATRNDHEAGITNGMTGIIIDIKRNPGYAGEWRRFGEVSEVAKYMADIDEEEGDFSLDDVIESHTDISAAASKAKEKKDRGPASHVVTVRFGEGEHGFEMPFATLAEVATLMTAYVVTCHKMQGGESPLVIIILHQSHKAMLNREWLYTAVTRASQKCVVFFTDQGLRSALNKQRIKGTNLAEKVRVFNDLQTAGVAGAAINIKLAESESLGTALTEAPVQTMLEKSQAAAPQANEDRVNRLAERLAAKSKPEPKVIERVTIIQREREIHHHYVPTPAVRTVKDGGDLKPTAKERVAAQLAALDIRADREKALNQTKVLPSASQRRDFVLIGKPRVVAESKRPEPLRLTYQPQPVEAPAPAKTPFRFGVRK